MPFPLPDPWIFEFLITTPGASIETVPLMSRSESTVFAFVTRSAPDVVSLVPTGTPVVVGPGTASCTSGATDGDAVGGGDVDALGEGTGVTPALDSTAGVKTGVTQ